MKIEHLLSAALALSLIAGSLACKKKDESSKATEGPSTSSAAIQPAAAQPSPADDMTAQLKKLAGSDARDCGTVPKSGDMQSASDCAMQTNDAKKPFWVRYELPIPEPKMAIATARAGDGKLYTVQFSSDGYQQAPAGATLSDDKKLMIMPCPEAPLRVAQSGRVTCFTPQQASGNVTASPHGGGMAMPPGASPHGTMPPASGPNPHGPNRPKPPSTTKSH